MSRAARYWVVLLPAALVAGAAVLFHVVPENAQWLPPCLFHKLTGLNCPGCGTTRALHALLHGDVAGALRLNVMIVVTVPLLVYSVVRTVRGALIGTRPRPAGPLPAWLPWTIAGVIVVFWIARNIPAYPFTLLAPH